MSLAKDKRTAAHGVELQHRHFSFIAAVLKEEKPGRNWDPNKMAQWEVTVSAFVRACQKSNPRFDSARFRTACGCDE